MFVESPIVIFCNSGTSCTINTTSQSNGWSRYVLVTSTTNDTDPSFEDFQKRLRLIMNDIESNFTTCVFDDFVNPNELVFRAEMQMNDLTRVKYYESDGTLRENPLRPRTKCYLRLAYCVPKEDESFNRWLEIEVHAIA